MRFKNINKRIVYSLIIAFLFIFIYLFFFDSIYFTKTYIDINTGNICKSEYIISVKIRSRVEKTEFSKLVDKLGINEKDPLWKLDDIQYFSVLRRIYVLPEYHGSIYACESFSYFLNLSDLPNNDKEKLIQECFIYLQKGEINKIAILTSQIIDKK